MPLPVDRARCCPRGCCSAWRWRWPARASAAGSGDRLSERRDRRRCVARRCWPRPSIFALTGYGLLSTGASGVRGTVALTPAGSGDGQRRGARRSATDGADDAVLAAPRSSWQGGGLVVDRLERTAPGVYRTTEPIPVTGEWKTMIRLHTRQRAERAAGLPARRPGDPGRGHPGRGADRARRSGPSSKLLQRERKADVAGWLWATAYGIVLAIALGFLVAARLGRAPRLRRAPAPTGPASSANRTPYPAASANLKGSDPFRLAGRRGRARRPAARARSSRR